MNEPFVWSNAKKRSLEVEGCKTAVSIEDEFWDYFCGIAKRKNLSINELATIVNATRTNQRLSLAIRLFCLDNAIEANQCNNTSSLTRSEGNGPLTLQAKSNAQCVSPSAKA